MLNRKIAPNQLVNESTQRKNKLTAICDELFPELTQVLKDPNLATALALREKFPTPHALATASLTALHEVKVGRRTSDANLFHLQQLAAQSIGTKDVARQRSLVLEQSLLIKELRLIQEHLEQLEEEVCQIITQSREGQILTSIPPIGPLDAATLIAVIGSIANFEKAGDLKSYLGWAPKREQTGTSYDRTRLTQGGSREAKRAIYLIVWRAIQTDTEWSKLYRRLVPCCGMIMRYSATWLLVQILLCRCSMIQSSTNSTAPATTGLSKEEQERTASYWLKLEVSLSSQKNRKGARGSSSILGA
jgi:transposase